MLSGHDHDAAAALGARGRGEGVALACGQEGERVRAWGAGMGEAAVLCGAVWDAALGARGRWVGGSDRHVAVTLAA
jgi:hypothetical protein